LGPADDGFMAVI